ncbi:choice-of-anchor B family protein [Pseudoalteromonas sp. C2R02]|uniref:choice-of-anchor B family protein n=1 Tax=Pseudoalteromonas sp. C2R02 TaxID=2841565 RepID=UPI001C0A1B0A|nr:choice-of-anchor B family protein [Pseudoalteromonas sp. C2R02]MBU2969486.1 choice-of-anchor B family protein [Pseudoalteromonas sp. C2R02]
MYQKTLQASLSFILITISSLSFAHIEHDKARYVSENGIDKGYCDKPFRACKTISYAVQQASKGDKVLVASGHYKLESESDVFYLQSQLVPVKAGFNRMDHFQIQSPINNPTFISNAPKSMHNALYKAGFTIVSDGKSNLNSAALKVKLNKLSQLSQIQNNQACQNGSAAGFECQNVDLISHIPLTSISGSPFSGSDIWGHIDLNNNKEYAIMGHDKGVTVFDLSVPSQPKQVGTISGIATSWRDIKVYQYFDNTLNAYQAFAYTTAESSDGIVIIDLNNLPNSVSKINQLNQKEQFIHNVYISNVDYGLGLALPGSEANVIALGGSKSGGAFRSYSLSDPTNIPISFENSQASRLDYTHDAASAFIKDERAQRDCGEASGKCTVLVDFNENEMRVWNISNSNEAKLLSSITYNEVSDDNKYVHSGWFSEDNRYVYLHDEFDETRGSLNTTVRIFDLQNLTAPVQVASWKSNNPTIDHNGFARGNRYYMSNYERGLTILDISDPINPVEIGFFDTFPSSNNSSFNGAWGVYPFLPSGLILLSDINSGLYVLKDNTKQKANDRLSFSSNALNVNTKGMVQIPVIREGNIELAASIDFETLDGSANASSDYTYVSGTLNWAAGDNTTQYINLEINKDFDAINPQNNLFIRLFNSQSHSAIGDFGYLSVNLEGLAAVGNISLAQNDIRIAENKGELALTFNRIGGNRGVITLNLDLSSNNDFNDDYSINQSQLIWADGETASKTILVNLVDDDLSELDEVISISLLATDEDGTVQQNQLQITLLDDENNQAPIINISNILSELPGRGTYYALPDISDPEGDEISFLWEQISGPAIEFVDPTQAAMNINVGDISGEFELKLTATDQRGASNSATVTMKVSVVFLPTPDEPEQKSSGSIYLLFILMFGIVRFRNLQTKITT